MILFQRVLRSKFWVIPINFAVQARSSFPLSTGKSSKEIEAKMKLEKWKNLQQQKSFQHLNPVKPAHVAEEHSRPLFISYNIDALREYSHRYPEFLLKELSNPHSQFHEMFQSQLNNFWELGKAEGFELALFYDGWDIKDTEPVERWVENHANEFTLDEMFRLLKTKFNVSNAFENVIISKLKDTLSVTEYEPLFKILNYYRLKGLGEDNFYHSLEEHFVKYIKNLSGSNIVRLLIHYANNVNETMEFKIRILELIEQRFFAISKFLNADELVAVLFCYLKLNMGSDALIQEIEERMLLNITIFKPQQIVRMLNLCSNLPKRQEHILSSVIAFMFKDKLHPKVLPTLYYLVAEGSLFTEEFLSKIQPILIANAHIMEPDEVAKCCWAFAIVQHQKKIDGILKGFLQQQQSSPTYLQFFRKVEEIVEGGLRDYTIKQVCTVVWALSSKDYNPTGQFWQQIESWLLQQLQNEKVSLRDVTLVMWAYTNTRPLLGKTVQLLLKAAEQKTVEMEPFDLSMCCWFVSQLAIPSQLTDGLLLKLHERFVGIVDEMEMIDIVRCLRWFVSKLSHVNQDAIAKILNRIDKEYLHYEYRLLVTLLSLLPAVKCKDRAKLASLVLKIHRRIQELKKVEVHPSYQEDTSRLKDEVQQQTKISSYRKFIKKKLEEDEV